ncbi:hypothetical protein B0H15DRAFT_291829 [Mycena belliarum]|uniref:Uncharacterized protein n=1 Tax=Mycena belliarum TaxID=1033014 RepID=A0AAD6U3H5_9AGAR|nr:hypothetical protein B0H15DRAFT_291829 [Mycena belliae]
MHHIRPTCFFPLPRTAVVGVGVNFVASPQVLVPSPAAPPPCARASLADASFPAAAPAPLRPPHAPSQARASRARAHQPTNPSILRPNPPHRSQCITRRSPSVRSASASPPTSASASPPISASATPPISASARALPALESARLALVLRTPCQLTHASWLRPARGAGSRQRASIRIRLRRLDTRLRDPPPPPTGGESAGLTLGLINRRERFKPCLNRLKRGQTKRQKLGLQ